MTQPGNLPACRRARATRSVHSRPSRARCPLDRRWSPASTPAYYRKKMTKATGRTALPAVLPRSDTKNTTVLWLSVCRSEWTATACSLIRGEPTSRGFLPLQYMFSCTVRSTVRCKGATKKQAKTQHLFVGLS